MPKLEVSQLEGWLIKKHSNENKSMFSLSSESRRWFKVREVKGIEEKELTLAYYASHRAKEAKGFIYLRDVTSIRATEDLSITLKSPARILTVFAETMVEHLFWLEGLVHLCASAEVSTGPNVTLQYKYREFEKPQEKMPAPTSVQVDYKVSEKESFYPDQEERTSLPGKDVDASEIAPSKIDREDHRLSGYRTGSSSGTTTRLHGHIRKDNEGASDIKVRNVESHINYQDAKDVRTPPRKVVRNQGTEVEISMTNAAPPTPNEDELESVSLTSYHLPKKSENVIVRKSTEVISGKPDVSKKDLDVVLKDNVSQKALRKASDEFDSSNIISKASIEDILEAPSRTTRGLVYDSDGDKEPDRSLDLDSEKQYYAEAKALRDNTEQMEQKSERSRSNSYLEQHLIENEGKHTILRQPLNSPPQYVQQGLSKVDQIREKLSTSSSAQIPSDDNFANEDWDNSPEREKGPSKFALGTEVESKDVCSKNAKVLITSSVRADDNWLDDDFDS